MKPTDLYMVLVCCNDDNGNMTRKCSGVQIYEPDDRADAVFDASCLLEDDPPSFWETKHGISFFFIGPDQGQIVRHTRRHYPCIHGAQHVGNIFWNAYFVSEDIAKGMAIDLMSSGALFCDGAWESRAEQICNEIEAKQKTIREWRAHPQIPGLKR